MAENIITLIRGDDSNFLNETLLIINFSSEDIDLEGFKAFLTIENSHNYTKKYDIKDGSIEIILNKCISSTLDVGVHRCNIKLIDTLGRIRTVKNFNIKVIDEFSIDEIQYNEYIIDVGFSSKDYNMLFNKPSINNVELSGNKTLEELGIQHAGNYSTIEYVDTLTENINSEIDSLELKVNKKSDIDYVDNELALKADKIDLNIKANISDIPTKVSQLVNDEGYLTEHQDISNKADIDYVEGLLDRKSDKADTYTKVEVNTLIDDVNDNIELKQDKLTAGENITIDENNVISAIGGASSSVTSVNGKTGDIELTAEDVGALPDTTVIPDISNLTTREELTQGLDTKQDKGNYALASDIPDLTDYVKNTDYATSLQGGVIKQSSTYGSGITNGILYASTKSLEDYNKAIEKIFISKGTLENIKDDYVKRGITENATELTADEKANAKQWLGYAEPTDIMQAIASIPQFNLSIVEALPETGAKMTLYLVPKEGTNNDVYDEYIWIEQTSSFEHLGTTAVDLTDYVKKTDYAGDNNAGVVKTSPYFGVKVNASGALYINKAYDADVKAKTNSYAPLTPSTLDLAVKTGVTTNTIELTDDEKTSARTWIGAIGNADYATASKAGVFTPSSYYATAMSGQYLYTQTKTLDQYKEGVNGMFVGKGTLENVLTQYSKTVLTTEADYEALETKDANTLYLIEE